MTPEKHDPTVPVERPVRSAQDAVLLEEHVEAECNKCGQPFLARRWAIMGVSLRAQICGACAEKMERAEIEAAERRRQELLARSKVEREAYWNEWCPKEFRVPSEGGGNTDLYRLELRQPRLKELLQWTGPRGILIRGPTGTCKTRSVWRLIRKLYLDGKRVRLLTAGQFDRECRDAGGNFTLTEWFNRLARADIFVLDDLGNSAWTNATEAQFFDLVDARGREGRPIFVTTQHTGESLKAISEDHNKMHLRTEALIRRLREHCDTLVFQ